MTPKSPINVLFLCTGNSARSVIAEAILNHLGTPMIHAFSAGSFPKGTVHPLALDLLKSVGLPTEGLRSKSWDEFAMTGAPEIDFIFTVCDNAAAEVCPIWPGKPITAHWGIPDPANVVGTEAEKAAAFRRTLQELDARIRLFLQLQIATLDLPTLKTKLREMGASKTANEGAPSS